jgi:transposase
VKNSLAAIKSCRERRPYGERAYVILDNPSAHKSKKVRAWCEKNNVELCFTPTYSSWANPVEAHFGPLREFVLNNSGHRDHTLPTNRLQAYLAWRNANPCDRRSSPPNARSVPR